MQRNDEQNAYLDVESTYIIEFGVKSFPISTHSIQQQRFREEYKEVLSFLDLKLKCGHPEKSQMGVLFSFMIRFIPNKNRNYTETRSPTVVTPTTKLFLFNCTLQLYSNKYKNRIFKRFSMRMLRPSRYPSSESRLQCQGRQASSSAAAKALLPLYSNDCFNKRSFPTMAGIIGKGLAYRCQWQAAFIKTTFLSPFFGQNSNFLYHFRHGKCRAQRVICSNSHLPWQYG